MAFTNINKIWMLDFRKIIALIRLIAFKCNNKDPYYSGFCLIIAEDK